MEGQIEGFDRFVRGLGTTRSGRRNLVLLARFVVLAGITVSLVTWAVTAVIALL